MEKEVKIEELKKYFMACNEICFESEIAPCKTIEEVVFSIGKSCSLIDYDLLEGAVEYFKVEKAKPAIEEYKKEFDDFYKEGKPLRDFLDKHPVFDFPLLQYKAATICVHKSIDEYRLADIDILMTVAFQRMALEVDLKFVRESNSFTITCSFPILLSESLIATALDNIESLIERGVKKLTIGYSTVYHHEKVLQYYYYLLLLLITF